MPRNAQFTTDHVPLADHKSLQEVEEHTTGPLSFFNPTRARFQHTHPALSDKRAPTDDPQPSVLFEWSSRNNRKGRHALHLVQHGSSTDAPNVVMPKSTSTTSAIVRNTWRMFVEYPYWDVSWLVAWWFTWGSIVWVINAFFVWLPLVRPDTEFSTEEAIGGGACLVLGICGQ